MAAMKMRRYIAYFGFIWFLMGTYLIYKGLQLISQGTFQTDSLCFSLKKSLGTPQQAGTVLIAIALIIGYIKGRFAMAKAVQRCVARIASLSPDSRFKDAFSKSYLILLGGMMLLGIGMRFLPIWPDLRGAIDVAIGSALVNGSMLFFRSARTIPA